jgi:hypothetical protein
MTRPYNYKPGEREKIVERMTRRMNELRVFARTEWIPSISDKPTRARAFQARAAMGKVSLPKTDLGEKVLNTDITRLDTSAYKA